MQVQLRFVAQAFGLAAIALLLFVGGSAATAAVAPTFAVSGPCSVTQPSGGEFTKTLTDLGPCTLTITDTPQNAVHNPPIENMVNDSGVTWQGFRFDVAADSFINILSIVDLSGNFSLFSSNALSALFTATGGGLASGGSARWQFTLADVTVGGPTLDTLVLDQTALLSRPGTVPEPATLALLGLGLTAFAAARRRRTR